MLSPVVADNASGEIASEYEYDNYEYQLDVPGRGLPQVLQDNQCRSFEREFFFVENFLFGQSAPAFSGGLAISRNFNKRHYTTFI